MSFGTPIFRLETTLCSSLLLRFEEWEQGGTPYNVRANYEKFNPANFVGQWQTPALIVHGGKDFRIPISQGIGAFTALQRRGIPSKLLYFPEEKCVPLPKSQLDRSNVVCFASLQPLGHSTN
jgi:dipeptidyl aminopeptidase/acylaminoacyl peptidase